MVETETDLAGFLKARFDEDDKVAFVARDAGIGAHAARMLREVEAKRLFLSDHEGVHRCDWGEHRGADHLGWCTTLKRLALPYADHSDYDAEGWRL